MPQFARLQQWVDEIKEKGKTRQREIAERIDDIIERYAPAPLAEQVRKDEGVTLESLRDAAKALPGHLRDRILSKQKQPREADLPTGEPKSKAKPAEKKPAEKKPAEKKAAAESKGTTKKKASNKAGKATAKQSDGTPAANSKKKSESKPKASKAAADAPARSAN